MKTRQLHYLFAGLALAPLTTQAATEVDKAWTLNLYFENDLFTDSDQQYTNGVRASWVSPAIDSFIDDPAVPRWIRSINKRLTVLDPQPEPFEDGPTQRLVVTVGQQMFTPEDHTRTTLDPNDRPYAGWLFMGFGYHTQTRHKLKSFEVNLGVVGPWSLAEESQNFIHDLRGFDRFQGWDNQLKNEPGIQLLYERKQRLVYGALIDNVQHDLIGHLGASLGNVGTWVNGGMEYRIGYQLPQDFGTSALRPGGDNSTPGHGDPRFYDQWGVHAFVSLDGRWVMHDIFLDGNSFRDSHSVDSRPWVADAAWGVAATWDRWKLSLARYYRTRQFEKQDSAHKFGSVALSYSF
ncbi:lipid A deacylase LpxR family protein [Marinobacterium litorale]|uniref:lipid A deacylase LpxR family protein n=1 Tax=Marinobacterium litorale TaxID=404770 RepID=UPI0003FC2CEA|nr:lipid A deacylase LpxR family protein [Marinobacterium litorale]